MWERGAQDWYALFGKSIRREAFSQVKIRNMQEYWMYFKYSEPQNCGKESAEAAAAAMRSCPLYYTRFAAFVKRAIFFASASVSCPGTSRQRQYCGLSVPGSFMRASAPSRR